MRITRIKNRHGYVLVLAMVALLVLLGMAALSIDLGSVIAIRQRAQSVADAAALAAASSLRSGMDEAEAVGRAVSLGAANQIMGRPVYLDPAVDVQVGAGDETTQQLVPWSPAFDTMAVRTTVRYCIDSPNGAAPLHFSKALGIHSSSVVAEAVASVGVSTHPRSPVDLMLV